ncbi:MAG: hypothetical protein ACRC6R_01425 [Bacteroidales bacterium]
MKKNFFRVSAKYFLPMMLGIIAVGCSSDDNNGNGGNEDEYLLRGELTDRLELKSGETYILSGGFTVKNGGLLKINKGVTIISEDDGDVDYILVEQGGMIDAQGTANEPIVMTSELKEPGAWGGIHICGRAPINLEGGTGKSEIGDATYGGSDINDNSGTLKYVRLEYTGFAFSEEKESNGFTFYGVGSGTTCEYLQAYMGADDGFEWFGGSVDAKYFVSTGSGDDSFDWTEGWNGRGQFWVAQQVASEGDCLIEADNNGSNNLSTPISYPTIANLTLIGNNLTSANRGVRLRAGTHVKMYNALVVGKDRAVTTETEGTENSFLDGTSVVEHTHVSTSFVHSNSEVNLVSKTGNAEAQTITFDGIVGTISGGKDMSAVDSYFTKAEYKGAISTSNNWTLGWTKGVN